MFAEFICLEYGAEDMTYNGENRKILAQYTKQKIFESAKVLSSSRNYKEVSVDSIVKMAGVSKGSFYVYYASKDALFASLINEYVTKADTDYRSFLDSFPDDSPAEVLFISLIGKIADVLIEIGCEKIQVLYQVQITKDMDTYAVTSYGRGLYKLFSAVLERGIKRGEFNTDIPLEVLTRHFMMAIRGITYEWCIRYPDFDYKTEALEHFKLLLKGLR